jgi:DNA-directed RNA polymerase specialized sigma24 family protein
MPKAAASDSSAVTRSSRGSAVGEWTFDPANGRHAGWEHRFTVFMRENERRLRGYVQRLAHGFTQAELDPEHVTQVTWARAAFRWPHIEKIEEERPGKAMAYLCVIARNLVNRAYVARAKLAATAAVEPDWSSAGQRAHPVAD